MCVGGWRVCTSVALPSYKLQIKTQREPLASLSVAQKGGVRLSKEDEEKSAHHQFTIVFELNAHRRQRREKSTQ